MQSFFFWKGWPKDYRWMWYALSSIFILSLGAFWIYYFQGTGAVIEWERIQEQKIIETTVNSFRLGPFQLSVPSESYVIFEYLSGGEIKHNLVATGVFLTVFAFCAVILLALITTLERFWYFAGMSIFIVLLITLRLDVLQLFGSTGYVVPAAILLIYVVTSFYFRYFRTRTSFIIRVSVFLIQTVVLAAVIMFFARVAHPAVHLMVTAYTPAMILTMLFIIMVAHEILVSFVYITSQGTTGNNVKHFSLISFIYLINIIITCLHEVGAIDWNFIYINLFLLVTISALLGFWGFKLREPLYENIFPFAPFGAFFFISMASICFITIAQLLGNANDAALKIIRYIIIFSHAGFGIIFVTYFLSNFIAMMARNIPVYNVLYKPNRMPYFTFRFAGLIASLAFLFYSNWRTFVAHGVAGFYNYVGDMHLLEGNEAYAITFYDQSRSHAFQNHRANYALATLKTSRLNLDGALNNYKLANGKRPTEFSLVNEGNLYLWSGRTFEAIASLKKSEKIAPESAAIKNNLGYTYAKVHALDSASYYLNESRNNALSKSSAETNFFAMAAAEYIPINTDSVLKLFDSNSPSVSSNALALATLFGQKITIEKDPLAERKLDLYSATFLNNYINYNSDKLDTTFLKRAHGIAADTLNLAFAEALKASLANAYYHQGKVYKALEILGELSYLTQNYSGKFNYVMGLWALEQEAPETAASYFTHAETADYKQARFYHAIALTEAGHANEAMLAWDSLAIRDDRNIQLLARQLKSILQINPAQVMNLPDPEKYQFCRYRIGLRDTVLFSRIINTFKNDNYKAQALIDIAKRLYKADQIIPAIKFLNQVGGLKLTDKTLYDDIKQLELLMLASRKEIRSLARQINKDVTFDQKHQLHKTLYTALISESSGDTAVAKINYDILAKANPFFEEGILAAAAFYSKQGKGSHRAYDILVDAIYVNAHSIRLLKAYAAEASSQGFDQYAASATERLIKLQEAIR
jgi:hypothetical protein